MFQGAVGRIVPRVLPPSPMLDLVAYLDAGGQPSRHRVWGGLATVSEHGLRWIETTLAELRTAHPEAVQPTGEIKGRDAGLDAAVKLGSRLREEDPGLLFWANWYPRSDGGAMHRIQEQLAVFLARRRAVPSRLDRDRVGAAFDRAGRFYAHALRRPVNRHKVVSMLAHLTWLTTRCGEWRLAECLRSVTLVIDNENLPAPAEAAYFIKTFAAAQFQAAGMAARLTGTALFEEAGVGTIQVRVDADSAREPGLQVVDVLLQAVQQRLPDYGRPSDSS